MEDAGGIKQATRQGDTMNELSKTLNMQNIREVPLGKKYSNLLGAHWCKQMQRWKSSIRVAGKTVRLGVFETAEDAAKAYLMAKRNLHSTCSI